MADKNTLKQWFVTGAKPLQAQYWAWLDSYWHKSEAISINNIENLSEILVNKADADQLALYAKRDASNINVDTWKEKLNIGSGGLSTVITDSTLQGDGSQTNPIGLSAGQLSDITNGVTAYGWGDHSTFNYLIPNKLTSLENTDDKVTLIGFIKNVIETNVLGSYAKGIRNPDYEFIPNNTISTIEVLNNDTGISEVPNLLKITLNQQPLTEYRYIIWGWNFNLTSKLVVFGVWINLDDFGSLQYKPLCVFWNNGDLVTVMHSNLTTYTEGFTTTSNANGCSIKFTILKRIGQWIFVERRILNKGAANRVTIYDNPSDTGNQYNTGDFQRIINPIAIFSDNINGITINPLTDYNAASTNSTNFYYKKVDFSKYGDKSKLEMQVRNNIAIRNFNINISRKINFDDYLINGNIIISGDSTIADNGTNQPSIASIIKASGTITNIAVPGHTINQQLAAWNTLTTSVKSNANYVCVQIGLNDLNGNDSTSINYFLSQYISKIKIDAPSAKILIGQMLPCKQRYVDLYGADQGLVCYNRWLALNAYIYTLAVNYVADLHTFLLNDGNDNLDARFNSGDNIHETTLGRKIIAWSWVNNLYNNQ